MSLQLQSAQWSDQRTDYVLGLLSAQAKRSFEEHLKSCAECQQAIAFERRLLLATRETLQTTVPSAAHLQTLRPPLPQSRKKQLFLPALTVWQPIMAAVVVFLIALGSFTAVSTSSPVIASTSTATLTQAPTAVATSQGEAVDPMATPPPPTPIAQLLPDPMATIPIRPNP